jgi:hypothetical protein
LISLESNKEWLDKFSHLENDNHKLFYIDAGNNDTNETGQKWIDFIENNEIIKNLNFEVCFIDQSPWTAHTYTLNFFKDKSKYIIVHDVDYFPGFGKWGKINHRIHTDNNALYKYDMDFSDVVKNYKVFYPPEEYFAGASGPSTLFCSNLASSEEFNKMVNNINYSKYYPSRYKHSIKPPIWGPDSVIK